MNVLTGTVFSWSALGQRCLCLAVGVDDDDFSGGVLAVDIARRNGVGSLAVTRRCCTVSYLVHIGRRNLQARKHLGEVVQVVYKGVLSWLLVVPLHEPNQRVEQALPLGANFRLALPNIEFIRICPVVRDKQRSEERKI